MNPTVSALVLSALIGGAAIADQKPAPAAKPTSVTKPAPTVPAAPTSAITHYVQAPGSSLAFAFEQAGARSNGAFKQFATTLDYDPSNLAASRLDVKIQIASLDTQDKDRDATLAGADLFDTAKYPTANYSARSLAKTATGLEAVGKLTIRDVTKELRIPLTLKPAGAGLELSGAVTIRRLDFGVGQGEWKATDSVGNDVQITYRVLLKRDGA